MRTGPGRRPVASLSMTPSAALWTALGLMLCMAVPAGATPLNPANYTSLGVLTDPTGIPQRGSINSGGSAPTITVGQTVFTGVFDPSGIAVFAFQSININSLVLSSGVAPVGPPVAILSQSTINIGSSAGINVSANEYTDGPGASNLGVGQPGGLIFVPPSGTNGPEGFRGGSGGGGFGGPGGVGESPNPPVQPPGGLGGAPYGDLSVLLQGGSHGGAGAGLGPLHPGGGGGAIELGATGAITIAGSIAANGGNAVRGLSGGDGGGSGGGIFVHGSSVTLTSTALLSANGGFGDGGASFANFNDATVIGAGGNGSGGRILIQTTTPGAFTVTPNSVSVAGGGNAPWGEVDINGQVYISSVPEPPSLVMAGCAALAGLAWAALRRRWRRDR